MGYRVGPRHEVEGEPPALASVVGASRGSNSEGGGHIRPGDRWARGILVGMADDPLELISIDAAVGHRQPCIKGTRVLVTVVLDALAAGLDAIVEHCPTLTLDGVRAAAACGAWLAKQEIRPLTPT